MPEVPTAETLPPTCSIKGLLAFGPGMHKGELYSADRCARTPGNFKALPGTVPTVKVGHDKQQRFAQSLGFSNTGHIGDCRHVPGYPGIWEVDLDNVPTDVGQQWNANWLKGSSVELNKQRHPDDATKELEPVLTGISLLGEEQPAVRNFPQELQHRVHPKATFADGREVPPAKSAARWLNAMADVTRQMAAEAGGEFSEERRTLRINGREYTDTAVCFSDFNPASESSMDPEAIKQALAQLSVPADKIEAMIAAMGTPAPAALADAPPPSPMPAPAAAPPPQPGAAMADDPMAQMSAFAETCKKYADDPAATPEQKMMSAMFSSMTQMGKKFSEEQKRTKEMAAAVEETQKKDEAAKMSAFSAEVDTLLGGEWDGQRLVNPHLATKIQPAARPAVKAALMAQFSPAVKVFASDTDRTKAFRDTIASYAKLPDQPGLAAVVVAAKPKGGANDKPTYTPAAGSGFLAKLVGPGSVLERHVGMKDVREKVSAG